MKTPHHRAPSGYSDGLTGRSSGESAPSLGHGASDVPVSQGGDVSIDTSDTSLEEATVGVRRVPLQELDRETAHDRFQKWLEQRSTPPVAASHQAQIHDQPTNEN